VEAEIVRQQELLREALASTEPYPGHRFDGRGIVICAGGARLLTCAWVLVNVLRSTLGCRLPIELWHLGPEELGPIEESLFAELDVVTVDALEVRKQHPARTLGGWELKSFAIVNSRFREVILLDADNVPVVDPAFLFDSPEYAETGALFWPDVEHIAADSEIWAICDVPYRPGAAVEAGQLVVDKSRCWRELQLVRHMNDHSDFYFDHLHGDKDTFLLAWLLTGASYAMPERLPKIVSRTIYQHGYDGTILFQHRNRAKWVLQGRNVNEPSFVHEDDCFEYIVQLRRLWEGRISSLPERTPDELALERELAQTRWFQYERIGSESRTLELASGNRVGVGHSGEERVWFVQDAALVLGSFAGITCRLTQRDDGVWTGKWIVEEEFDVELRALAEPPAQETTRRGKDPRTGAGARNPGLRLQGASSTWRYEFVGTFDDAEAQLTPAGDATLLVLTPVKNGAHHLATYFTALAQLDYPPDRTSLGFLVGDSDDGSYEALADRLPELEQRYRRVHLLRKDFGFRLPDGVPRWAPEWQLERRRVLAQSRNQLLFAALRDEEWVLWLDVDVVEYPPDVVRRMLATGRSIVQPHCVVEYGGPTFDRNGWRDRGRLHLDDLRGEELVRLDSVGGAMLLVDAEAHRNGLVFPPTPYGGESPLARNPHPVFGVTGEVETEGLGLMAADMGYECWGMPNLEVRHADA